MSGSGLVFVVVSSKNKLLLWLTFVFFFFFCTRGGGDAPASLLFTLLIRGQLRAPVPLFQHTRQKACHSTAMIFTMPIRSRLSSWTHCERPRLAVRRTWGVVMHRRRCYSHCSFVASYSTLVSAHRQKGLSPRCHDFHEAHQEQVELMDALRKDSLGGKTHIG